MNLSNWITDHGLISITEKIVLFVLLRQIGVFIFKDLNYQDLSPFLMPFLQIYAYLSFFVLNGLAIILAFNIGELLNDIVRSLTGINFKALSLIFSLVILAVFYLILIGLGFSPNE